MMSMSKPYVTTRAYIKPPISIKDKAKELAKQYGITENMLIYCKIKVIICNESSYIKIIFPKDDSYVNFTSGIKGYISKDKDIQAALYCNHLMYNKDTDYKNNNRTYSYIDNSSDYSLRFQRTLNDNSCNIEIKLKTGTFTTRSCIYTKKRGNQYINALYFKIDRSLYYETKSNASESLLIASPTRSIVYQRFPLNFSCSYSQTCFNYIKSLNWNMNYFDVSGNRCYCNDCFPTYWINSQEIADETYIIPRGWMRFGLKVPFIFSNINNAWDSWSNAFHGTNPESAYSIIQHKTLLLHGDFTSEGVRIGVNCSAEEWGNYYVSPHICYASHPWYSKVQHAGMRNGKKRYAQIAFAVKMRKGSYLKQRETEGGAKRIFDDYSIIPENEIEWYSKRRGCVMPYGVLIRVFGETREQEIMKTAED